MKKEPKGAAEKPALDTPRNPLASAAGREFIAAQLVAAEREERHGPGGAGWLHNETKRPVIEERVAFFRALLAALPQ